MLKHIYCVRNWTLNFLNFEWKKRKINQEISSLPFFTTTDDVDIRTLLENDKKRYELQLKNVEIGYEIHHLSYHKTLLSTHSVNITEQRRQFVRACPAEGCRGFLSSQWKCGLCDVWVCPDCHEVKGMEKDIEHTCKPENIATAQFLAKDSKPCPKCAAMIFKIDGCSQIWCTQCQTAFDWKTGKIETGRIHNPHYYEYLRNHNGGVAPREPGDVACGGLRDNYWIKSQLNKKVKYTFIEHLMSIFRVYHHIDGYEIQNHQVNLVNDNRDLRIKYLAKELDEKSFKRTLQQREKLANRKTEMLMVLQMFVQATIDITQRMVADIELYEKEQSLDNVICKYLDEYETLREYANECSSKIAKRYNQNTLHIRSHDVTKLWSVGF